MEHQYNPYIFELLACDSLKSGLREALRYLLDRIYQIDFVHRLPIPKVDETVLMIDVIIEYNYLRTYNAAYAENLYNLLRLDRRTGAKLNSHLPSLVALTFAPYIKRKLDRYFEDLNYKPDRTADEVKKIRFYRLLCKSGSFLNLLCLARLAAGRSNYHNLTDALLNVRLAGRCKSDDEPPLTWTDACSKAVADLMGRTLTVGSYMIQFLDYWNTHSNSTPLFNASLPIPPAPKIRPKTDDLDDVKKEIVPYSDDKSSNLCLICLHVRQNECVLSNTGYVYCYSCLQRYVKTKQRCPVTNHPTKLDNIVKLYSNSNINNDN